MRDLIYVILVPNPSERPNIDQLLSILQNWNNVPKINLSEAALEIKNKNMGVTAPQEKKGMGDITADDLAKM